jgi:hypothetical protein
MDRPPRSGRWTPTSLTSADMDEVDQLARDQVSLDAVAAWVRWRDVLGSHGSITGPAWRGIDRYGRRPRPAA